MQPTDRLHALDAVRAFALLCGVVLHSTMAYLPGMPPFLLSPAHETTHSVALGLTFFVIHVFRMTSFFLIAGFFARRMLHAKGALGFVKNRLLRIAVPLVVGWPLVIASVWGLWLVGLSLFFHGAMPKAPAAAPGHAAFLAFPLTHLWFLYVLLELYVATLLIRGLFVLVDREGRLRDALADGFAALIRSGLGVFVLAAPVAAALSVAPAWTAWFGIPTPDSSLVAQPVSAIAFFMAFATGWLIEKRPELLQTLAKRWVLHLILALGLGGVVLAILGLAPNLAPATPQTHQLILAMAYAGASISSAFALIGLAMRFLSRPNGAIRYLADASYWIYLAHLPLVYALQIAISGLNWPAEAKFALVAGVAITVLLLSYEVMVRYSFIGAVLNGRRRRAGRPPARAAIPA